VTLRQPVVEARRNEELLGLVVVAKRLVKATGERFPLGLDGVGIDGEELFVIETVGHASSLAVS
jgi:hypothetical protein